MDINSIQDLLHSLHALVWEATVLLIVIVEAFHLIQREIGRRR